MNWNKVLQGYCLDINDDIRICVCNYLGYEKEWFVTCHEIGINKESLKCEDLEEAKNKAADYTLKTLLDKINYFRSIHETLYSNIDNIN